MRCTLNATLWFSIFYPHSSPFSTVTDGSPIIACFACPHRTCSCSGQLCPSGECPRLEGLWGGGGLEGRTLPLLLSCCHGPCPVRRRRLCGDALDLSHGPGTR